MIKLVQYVFLSIFYGLDFDRMPFPNGEKNILIGHILKINEYIHMYRRILTEDRTQNEHRWQNPICPKSSRSIRLDEL